ncbi:hypothetical protein QTQ03_22670 [Micromonospora sp. WMMA1363]|uniref:hypothetical protein n=1 Tax=Micromonospora sp. WMMA1363 TaxID=3053985 RepID=UPI00259CD474|nr:hypothetical protein [Micromonospora sp. WMMA1363]MDM4722253.1 hypothetical protein [Micromonospora sp. WMMA1363]
MAALIVMAMTVGVELGTGMVSGGGDAAAALRDSAGSLGVEIGDTSHVTEPPGRGTSYLALVDAVAVWTTGLLCLSLIVPRRIEGRAQGIATLIFAIMLILGALAMLAIAIIRLTVMVSLLLAFPFGTLAYLVIWGFFPVGKASVIVGLLLSLKLTWAILLLLAQPRFLQNIGLVALALTTMVCTVVLGFLHHMVPRILVSITDDIGAVIFAVVAVIWGIVMLIGSIPGIVMAFRPPPPTLPRVP